MLSANGFFTRFIVYSCLHSLFYALHRSFRFGFVAHRTLSYHPAPEGAGSVASVYRLAPDIFGADVLDQ